MAYRTYKQNRSRIERDRRRDPIGKAFATAKAFMACSTPGGTNYCREQANAIAWASKPYSPGKGPGR